MAQINHITLNFDSNITEIKEGFYSGTVTTSGQSIDFPGTSTNFYVTLTDGYALNTVVASSGTISDITSNSFKWTFGDNANITITLTSKVATVKKSIDLTTLPGWANLSSGNHTTKIKAKGTGYKESELSAGVVVNKAPSTVTLEAGTYKWKDNMSVSDTFPINDYKEVFSFESNGITDFAKIRFYISGDYYSMYYEPDGSFAEAWYGWGNNWWYNTYDGDSSAAPGLQTITLSTDQQVSAEFYKWAITDGNLVKQAAFRQVPVNLRDL